MKSFLQGKWLQAKGNPGEFTSSESFWEVLT
jgi:hypothetical protein